MPSRDASSERTGSDSGQEIPVALSPVERGAGRRRGGRRRGATQVLGVLVVVGVAVAAVTVPMPYVVDGPGPTVDVTAASDGTPLIEISGTDPTTGQAVQLDDPHASGDGVGQLRMVTVSEEGGPAHRLNFVQLVAAWLDRRDAIIPYSQAYPDEVTQEQVDEAAQAQMTGSQSSASVAALESLGWTVPATVTIEGAVSGSDAENKIQQGDVMVSVTTPDGVVHAMDSASTPFTLMKTQPVGTALTLTVARDGQNVDIPITTVSGGEGAEGSKLGIYLSADADLPVDITIHLSDIGGPSAGTMFALGIIDQMTPGDMTGGQNIAGTGALSYDGTVEAIGGIRQKMWGAVRDGATWFLAPSSNCDEVIGHVPDGLSVVTVSTLAEARSAVEAIANGEGDTLATCSADGDAES